MTSYGPDLPKKWAACNWLVDEERFAGNRVDADRAVPHFGRPGGVLPHITSG